MSPHPEEDAMRRLIAAEVQLDQLCAILDRAHSDDAFMSLVESADCNPELINDRIEDCLTLIMTLKSEFPSLNIDREAPHAG
jgi:hypothetical protein